MKKVSRLPNICAVIGCCLLGSCDDPPASPIKDATPPVKVISQSKPQDVQGHDVAESPWPADAHGDETFAQSGFGEKWDAALKLDNIVERAKLLDDLIRRNGAKFPMDVASVIENLPPGRFRSERYASLMKVVSLEGIVSLASRFGPATDPLDRDKVRQALGFRNDLTGAVLHRIASAKPGDGVLQRAAAEQLAYKINSSGQLPDLAALAKEFPQNAEIIVDVGMQHMLSSQEGRQEVKALFEAGGIEPSIRAAVVDALTTKMFAHSVGQTRAFVESIKEPDLRVRAAKSFLPLWMSVDSVAASGWVDSMKPDAVKADLAEDIAYVCSNSGDREGSVRWSQVAAGIRKQLDPSR